MSYERLRDKLDTRLDTSPYFRRLYYRLGAKVYGGLYAMLGTRLHKKVSEL